ncbi:MAG TPA: resolvase [Bacteroidales bacterium]|nr:resolvase [Bacteroidales bacterium]
MMTTDATFAKRFGKKSPTIVKRVTTGNVVVYTRVSSKEQADKNLSLETQKKAIEEYSKKHNLNIVAYFGGTYESAKTDGRKEFNRMLEFIKKSNGKISQVLVYTLDRFSRTGGAAIKIVTDLREKQGISVFAVTQPTDTSNPSGVLHQNIQFLFSEYDNQLRKQKAVAGMVEKLKKGIWVTQPPQGYDVIKINGTRKIVLNEEGKKLKNAFEWKLNGLKNDDIILKLRAMGANIYKQKLHKIFCNPFYCGVVSHGLLNGQVVDGTHEAMVSKETFLKVNNIISESPLYGVPHKAENDNIPLKVFLKCSECGQPFTGYLMKARNIYYYKCRTIGCQCNKNAKDMHQLFISMLANFRLKESLKKAVLFQLENTFNELTKSNTEKEKAIKTNLTEVTKKLDLIEEKFYVMGEMSKETFERFYSKYKAEQIEIIKELNNCQNPISNNKNILNRAIYICDNLQEMWASGNVVLKERLQRLVFPEGIVYDRKIGAVRTLKLNSVFASIAHTIGESSPNKKGTSPFLLGKSLSAEREGFEPPDP